MKRSFITWLLVLVLLAGLASVPRAEASDNEFVIENGILTGYNGNGGNVTVPEGVTEIDSIAFNGLTALTGVKLPESLTSIPTRAFEGCTGLTEVTIPDGVKEIGLGAFLNCPALKQVTIQGMVPEIRLGAFGHLVSTYNYDPDSDTVDGLVILGWPESSAQYYARSNGFEFVELEGTPPEIPQSVADRWTLKTILEPTYAAALPFHEGLAAVSPDGSRWGYISEKGEWVIQPKYDYALSFQDGVGLVAYNDGSVHSDYEAVYILKPDGTEIPLYTDAGYVTDPDGTVRWDASGTAPLTFRREPGCFSSFDNGFSGGVVRALGNAYTKDGILIKPAGYDGFACDYQDYQVIAPAVDGIIPCKALYYNREAYGQCFYMDTDGTVLYRFGSADAVQDSSPEEPADGIAPGGGDPPPIQIYAPDPETGHIMALDLLDAETGWTRYGVYNGSTDIRNHLDDWETWDTFMLSINPGFLNLRLQGDGSIYHHGFATVQMEEDTWALMREEVFRSFFMTEKNMENWMFDGEGMGARTFEAAGSFGQGEEDVYCPVKENSSWHYVSAEGYDYAVEDPNGDIADVAIAGSFQNGFAPVYDSYTERAYLICADPVKGILPMVKAPQNLALSVYFPDFTPGEDSEYGLTREVGEIVAIQDDLGKIGFARLVERKIVSGEMTAFDNESIAWSLETGSGELTVSGEVSEWSPVLAARYSENRQFLDVVWVTEADAPYTLPLGEDDALSLFWLDEDWAPRCASESVDLS